MEMSMSRAVIILTVAHWLHPVSQPSRLSDLYRLVQTENR